MNNQSNNIKNRSEIIEMTLKDFENKSFEQNDSYYSITWKRDRELLFKILKRTLGKIEDLVELESFYPKRVNKQYAEINECLSTIYYLFEELNPVIVELIIEGMLTDYKTLANNNFEYSVDYQKYFK